MNFLEGNKEMVNKGPSSSEWIIMKNGLFNPPKNRFRLRILSTRPSTPINHEHKLVLISSFCCNYTTLRKSNPPVLMQWFLIDQLRSIKFGNRTKNFVWDPLFSIWFEYVRLIRRSIWFEKWYRPGTKHPEVKRGKALSKCAVLYGQRRAGSR